MSESNNLQYGFDFEAFKQKNKPRNNFADVKEGTNYFHIIPPLSKTNRQLSHTYNTHWLQNGDRKVQVACTYYTEKFCPICEAHKQVNNQLESLKKAQKEGQPVTADVMKELETAEWSLRKSKNVLYTAVNVNGEIVALKLSSTVSGLLDKMIDKAITEENFDPTNPQTGCWYRFDRAGKGREAVTVSFKESLIDFQGRKLKETDRTPLSEETVQKITNGEGPDIHDSYAMYIRDYSAADLAAYLNGTPLPQQQRGSAPATQQAPAAPQDNSELQKAPTVASAPAFSAAPPVSQASAPVPDSNVAAEIARLRALTGKK